MGGRELAREGRGRARARGVVVLAGLTGVATAVAAFVILSPSGRGAGGITSSRFVEPTLAQALPDRTATASPTAQAVPRGTVSHRAGDRHATADPTRRATSSRPTEPRATSVTTSVTTSTAPRSSTTRSATPSGTTTKAAPAAACPFSGHITWTLGRSATPTADEKDAYAHITDAMTKAVNYYNCHTPLTKALHVSYSPDVPTADGNPNGSIRFGSNRGFMQIATAMHEISHTLGVGDGSFRSKVVNGVFTGAQATAVMRTVTNDPKAVVHSDGTHLWPYGLNYESEYTSDTDLLNHCLIVTAMSRDLGYL